MKFELKSNFKPMGDQPQAIAKLVDGLNKNQREQTLLGVTGSGKTFTMAKIIEKTQRPTLVISHNKTLAAQLYGEFKQFFPNNAVHYFVSYYDYYQPEAYIPQTDTYIEKEATINEEIDRLRHAATQSLLNRRDCLIVASVSCIYGLGSKEDYQALGKKFYAGQKIKRNEILRQLVEIQYERNDTAFLSGQFRVKGDIINVHLATGEAIVRIEMFGDQIETIKITPLPPFPKGGEKDESLSKEESLLKEELVLLKGDEEKYPPAKGGRERFGGRNLNGGGVKNFGGKINETQLKKIIILPAKHFMAPEEKIKKAIVSIRAELKTRLAELKKQKKIVEAERLERKTNYDLEMIEEAGYCNGIENYSRHLTGRPAGSPPETLMDFFGDDFLIFIDESHATVPQIRGMYAGDRSRKQILIDFGFRLPSALDNRPLNFQEFNSKINQIIYVSATPGEYEIKNSTQVAEQIIRPTGLLDPIVEIRPTQEQISDLIKEIEKRVVKKQRVLATTLTKRMAEELADFLIEKPARRQAAAGGNIKACYLHSEIDTLERVNILRGLREGKYDVVVGINLLREGLDLPEVSLVAILDADMSGLFRNETSLIQIMGRAARHAEGKVIMYADTITPAIRYAVNETKRRRRKQEEYNKKHGIKPRGIKTKFHNSII